MVGEGEERVGGGVKGLAVREEKGKVKGVDEVGGEAGCGGDDGDGAVGGVGQCGGLG